MLDRRVQLLLDQRRYDKVVREADRRRVSVAAVIRDVIDESLPSDIGKQRKAVAAILRATAMPVPTNPGDVRKQLDEDHDRVA